MFCCTLQAEHVFLATGQVEIGVNSHDGDDDDGSSSQDGLRSWSDLSHTEPLSMTVSHYSHLSHHDDLWPILSCRVICVFLNQ